VLCEILGCQPFILSFTNIFVYNSPRYAVILCECGCVLGILAMDLFLQWAGGHWNTERWNDVRKGIADNTHWKKYIQITLSKWYSSPQLVLRAQSQRSTAVTHMYAVESHDSRSPVPLYSDVSPDVSRLVRSSHWPLRYRWDTTRPSTYLYSHTHRCRESYTCNSYA
jgi:hypothetical protein